ncbi:hypothetical protein ACFWWU_36435 [Streptomyces sp. NPDC058650]|uniref:hypothetical protein n=1 Tax=Streptomyces sp. NPDC058650 TaxID=3346575 RepID=UPI00364B3B88
MDTSNMWWSATDALPKESELETVEQKLAYAQVLALLSISQEINGFVLGESPLGEKLSHALDAVIPKGKR